MSCDKSIHCYIVHYKYTTNEKFYVEAVDAKSEPHLKYKPKPQLYLNENHQIACASQLDSQIFLYGKQIFVNLIDHREAEDIFDDTIMLSLQDGIFCYNCINCLDETNVVQSMLPKHKITDVLMIFKKNELGGFRGTNDLQICKSDSLSGLLVSLITFHGLSRDWLDWTDGTILSGRKFYDGTG
ncbi:hypothetical protein PV326_011373, partial [Microctonus aethiopoides]